MQQDIGFDLMCPEHQEKIISVQLSETEESKMYCIKCFTKQQMPIESLLQQLEEERMKKQNYLIDKQNQSEECLGQLKKFLTTSQDLFYQQINDFIKEIDDQRQDIQQDYLEKINQLNSPIKQMTLTSIDLNIKDLKKQSYLQDNYQKKGQLLKIKVIQQYRNLLESVISQVNQFDSEKILYKDNPDEKADNKIKNIEKNALKNLSYNQYVKIVGCSIDSFKTSIFLKQKNFFYNFSKRKAFNHQWKILKVKIKYFKQQLLNLCQNAYRTQKDILQFFITVQKECPNCGTMMLNNDGPTLMKCKACKMEFCQECKQNWKIHEPGHCDFQKIVFYGLQVTLALCILNTLGILSYSIYIFYPIKWLISSLIEVIGFVIEWLYNFYLEWLEYIYSPILWIIYPFYHKDWLIYLFDQLGKSLIFLIQMLIYPFSHLEWLIYPIEVLKIIMYNLWLICIYYPIWLPIDQLIELIIYLYYNMPWMTILYYLIELITYPYYHVPWMTILYYPIELIIYLYYNVPWMTILYYPIELITYPYYHVPWMTILYYLIELITYPYYHVPWMTILYYPIELIAYPFYHVPWITILYYPIELITYPFYDREWRQWSENFLKWLIKYVIYYPFEFTVQWILWIIYQILILVRKLF